MNKLIIELIDCSDKNYLEPTLNQLIMIDDEKLWIHKTHKKDMYYSNESLENLEKCVDVLGKIETYNRRLGILTRWENGMKFWLSNTYFLTEIDKF